MSRLSRQRSTSVDVESLELRRLLVAFGTPWPDSRDLAISIPSDGVEVGRYDNNLSQTLDQVAARDDWEELVIRAYQTWTIHADINIGLRNDFDMDFGAPGLMTSDPRFGEFRIGAFPQEGLLANSLPFQTLAGTYSGDLLLNSNEQFTYHDWANDLGPDPASLGELDRDLFSLLLHEAGNTLGLEDSESEDSVMFRQYTVPKGVLTQEDITRIQDLYGHRTDPFEANPNEDIATSTLMPTPVGFDASQHVIRTRGSLLSGSDVDVYELTPESGHDSVTLKLKARGISLLLSDLQVFDSSGQILASSVAPRVTDNDHHLEITGLSDQSPIYIQVAATDPQDVYAVGDYELVVDYRDQATQDADLVLAGHRVGPESLFTNFDLVDNESDLNETKPTATSLSSQPFDSGRFEAQGAIASAGDVDWYKVKAPATESTRLLVSVAGVGQDAAAVQVNIVGENGENVGATGRLHHDGTWELEVTQPIAGADYYLRISVDPNSTASSVGNYVTTAHFETPNAQMNQLAAGDVTSEVDEYIRWTAGVTKLYRFDFNVEGANEGDGAYLAIYDAHTREIRMLVRAEAGQTRNALAWLQQGDYILRFTVFSDDPQTTSTVNYSLLAEGLSDDQDEDHYDPSEDPDFYSYEYEYVDPFYTYIHYQYYVEIYYDFEEYYEDYYYYPGESQEMEEQT